MTTKDTRFAVAVRDGGDLWLFLSLMRDRKGNVYVFWPRDEPDWNPHASHHASGRAHQKSFGKAFISRIRQKPDAAFSGTEQIVTTPVYLSGVRANHKPCRKVKYGGGVFEIGAGEISPMMNDCRTAVAIDLVSPGAPALVQPWSEVVRQHVFTDAVPHILITLWNQRMTAGVDETAVPSGIIGSTSRVRSSTAANLAGSFRRRWQGTHPDAARESEQGRRHNRRVQDRTIEAKRRTIDG